jgi:hypothetical protein
MKRVSMWVTLSMSLITITAAIAQPPANRASLLLNPPLAPDVFGDSRGAPANSTNANRAIIPQGNPRSTSFKYEERQIEILEQIRNKTTPESFIPGSTGMVNPAVNVPNVGDFDNDGFEDVFLDGDGELF